MYLSPSQFSSSGFPDAPTAQAIGGTWTTICLLGGCVSPWLFAPHPRPTLGPNPVLGLRGVPVPLFHFLVRAEPQPCHPLTLEASGKL